MNTVSRSTDLLGITVAVILIIGFTPATATAQPSAYSSDSCDESEIPGPTEACPETTDFSDSGVTADGQVVVSTDTSELSEECLAAQRRSADRIQGGPGGASWLLIISQGLAWYDISSSCP